MERIPGSERLDHLRALARAAAASGRSEGAVAYQQILAADPTDEEARTFLVDAALRAGDANRLAALGYRPDEPPAAADAPLEVDSAPVGESAVEGTPDQTA